MAPLLFIASNHKRNFLISSPASYVASNFISWSLSLKPDQSPTLPFTVVPEKVVRCLFGLKQTKKFKENKKIHSKSLRTTPRLWALSEDLKPCQKHPSALSNEMQHSDEPIAQRSSVGSFGQETPADINSALKVPKTAFLRSEIPASQFQCHRKELPSPQNASTRPYRWSWAAYV
ncbi:alternative cyclin pcl12 [Moniliophthora roreri]|nr:alternative cyclin pcl12 [Moniliophthora roreri]